jgi:hypothetical protein
MGEQAATKVVDHGSTVFMSTQRYGAELSTKQFSLLIAAITLGTLLECEYEGSLSAQDAQQAGSSRSSGQRRFDRRRKVSTFKNHISAEWHFDGTISSTASSSAAQLMRCHMKHSLYSKCLRYIFLQGTTSSRTAS